MSNKRLLAKLIARMKIRSDEMWAAASKRSEDFERLLLKDPPWSETEVELIKQCLGIVVIQVLMNTLDVEASNFITPEDEKRYGEYDS